MRIPLDYLGEIPLYKQIENFFREGILAGTLKADTRLPASRKLAADLGISRITVENAYAELKADGLISARAGSGTYVLPHCSLSTHSQDNVDISWPLWQDELLIKRTLPEKDSPKKLLKTFHHPDLISFADGSGDPQLFPIEDFRRSIQTVIRQDGIELLKYGDPSGLSLLRTTIARVLTSQGLITRADNILITSGSQQALALVSQLLLKAGDVILVESPTYAKALDLFRTLSLKIVGIPVDQHGMQVEQLEKLLQQFHPKLIYTMPNFQNPTGASLSSQRRQRLISLADRYNVPILEDDFVGDLRYEGRTQPTLKALDPGGRVIYTSTFSKMLLPGLRVGFIVTTGPVYEELVNLKQIHDLGTSSLIQRALEIYVTIGRYQKHLERSCRVYRKRRNTMLRAIKLHLSSKINLSPPQGGLFIWLSLADNLSVEKLLPLAYEEGVSFAPGNIFFPDNLKSTSCLRLNFAAHAPEEIEEGIKRLGKALHRLK